MPETLNEKALQAARDTVKTATAYNQSADISTVADIAIRAYLSSLPAGDYAGLVGDWQPIETAPKGCVTEDAGCRGSSEWFFGRTSAEFRKQGAAPFVVIRRRAWPQEDSWECNGEANYVPGYFDGWAPLHSPTAIAALSAERDALHVTLITQGHELKETRTTREAAEAEVKAMGEALSEVEGCFDAAFAEGLQERLNDEADRSLGTLYDLVTRRLLSAHDASRRARAVKEG